MDDSHQVQQQYLLCMFSNLRQPCDDDLDEASFAHATRGARVRQSDGGGSDIEGSSSLWSVRLRVASALRGNHASAAASLGLLQKYAAALGELPDARLRCAWRTASSGHVEEFGSLHWERCNVLWSMVALLAYQSAVSDGAGAGTDAGGGSKTAPQQSQQPFWYLQAAASLCQTLRSQVQELLKSPGGSNCSSLELSPTFLAAWQDVLLAHAQRAAYESFAQAQKQQPRHFLLAQLAAGAVPLLGAAERSCERAMRSDAVLEAAENEGAEDDFARASFGQYTSFFGMLDMWNQAVQAWGMYLNSMAEYHEALKQGLTVTQQQQTSASSPAAVAASPIHEARLAAAIRYAELAQVFLDQADDATTDDAYASSHACSETRRLDTLVRNALDRMRADQARLAPAAPYHDDAYEHPSHNALRHELPAIRPQQTVKIVAAASDAKILPTLTQLRLTLATEVPKLPSPSSRSVSSHRTPQSSSNYPPTSFSVNNRQTPPSVLSSPAVSAAHAATGSSNSGVYMSPSAFERHRQSFLHQVMDLHHELATLAQTKTEAGRQALTAVDLPHALTTFHREQQQQQHQLQMQHEQHRQMYDGAISAQSRDPSLPPQLWARVANLQQQSREASSRRGHFASQQHKAGSDYVSSLQRQLWELRDAGDLARSLLKQMDQQLMEDLEMDRAFRQEAKHADFTGHDVLEVQRAVRDNLSHYAGLLQKAQESDDVLGEQCQSLETDPKFELLKFDRDQLEHLMVERSTTHAPPPRMSTGSDGQKQTINVSMLSKHLVELSALFEMRESNLQVMHRRIHDFPFEEELLGLITSGIGAEQALSTAVEQAKESVQIFVDKVEASIERQAELLRCILKENEEFVRKRDALQPAAGGNCIAKLEDALNEIDAFAKHLKEGKDFYDVLIPKLERLKTQVEDVSARLTIERMEFEDRIDMSRQEADDARMAARVAEQQQQQQQQRQPDGPTNGAGGAPSPPARRRSNPFQGSTSSGGSSFGSVPRHGPAGYPGVEQVDHMEPMVRVDDSMVATLIAMDFDPDKVVAALRLYDNNFDQALNELLSG